MKIWISRTLFGTALCCLYSEGLVTDEKESDIGGIGSNVGEIESETRLGQLQCADPKFIVKKCTGHSIKDFHRRKKKPSKGCGKFKKKKCLNLCKSCSTNKCKKCCSHCQECLKEINIAYHGKSIDFKEVSGVSECANWCLNVDSCKFWTFYKQSSWCHIKTSNSGRATDLDGISGTKNCGAPVIDGGWSSWSCYGTCSATCGAAVKTRIRSCSNPIPSDGGQDCKGIKNETITCNLDSCGIDGGWSKWGTCSKTCEEGLKRRSCINPVPAGGGAFCIGNDLAECNNNKTCAINGGWSEWSDFGACSATCGAASKTRRRTCSNPPPRNGGKICQGITEETVNCSVEICNEGCSSGIENFNISNTEGMIFTSPNYTGNYPDNLHCKWIFTAPPGEKISFTILEIDTEFGYDVIKIYDEIEEEEDKAPILSTMSGTELQEAVISSQEKIRVTFISDENVNRRGFKATLKTLKRIDLPKFNWIDLFNLRIIFPNGANETIKLSVAPRLKTACIFEGRNNQTSVIIKSPLSSDECRSLDQYVEIVLVSTNLAKKTEIYSLKNGQLKQIDETIFHDNTINRGNRSLENIDIPNLIRIKIQFGYDKGLFNKFQKYGQGKAYIEKRVEELFYHSKWSLQGILTNANIELMLEKEVLFINEVLKVNNSCLLKGRKYQLHEEVPIIILLEDDFGNNKKGLSFRSGACRKDRERYGVALVAWRDDGGLAGEVLTHEMGHLIGGFHVEGNNTGEKHHHHDDHHHDDHHHNDEHEYETEVGHTEFNDYNVKLWFNKTGYRCYGKSCSAPPSIRHGTWHCVNNNQTCEIKCDKGFTSPFSHIKCENGNWSEILNEIACSPSVYLIAAVQETDFYQVGGHKVGIYHPLVKNLMCSNILPPLGRYWTHHTIFTHHSTIYLCGGWDTSTKCISSNSQQKDWKKHSLDSARIIPSSIVMKDRVYIMGASSANFAVSSKLPLSTKPEWVPVDRLNFVGDMGLQCVVKIDSNNFVVIGGYYLTQNENMANVTKYNVEDEDLKVLAPLKEARSWHGCVAVEKMDKLWIVVTGGTVNQTNFQYHQVLGTTEIMDMDQNKWKRLGNLNVARAGHGMIEMERGIIVFGGKKCDYYWECFLHSVELLDWESQQWILVEPSLMEGRSYYGGVVEISASVFNCHLSVNPDKNCGSRHCSSPKGCPLTANNLITTLSGLNKEFYISLEFLAKEYITGWQNVIHLTESKDCCDVGHRIPALWVKDSGQLYLSFAINGDGNYNILTTDKYPAGQWHHVEFSQTLEDNKYMYQVKINERIVLKVENTQPMTFSNVKVFVANRWHNSLRGSIRNLFINIEGENKCEGTNSKGVVSLSSSNSDGQNSASNCVDGNLDTFCQTKNEAYPFLVVEYPQNVLVKEVKLVTRSDCCGDDARKMIVSVRNVSPSSGELIPGNLWRDDGRCGENYPAYGGERGQCDPTANANEEGPCCSSSGWCGSSSAHCNCESCINYAVCDAGWWQNGAKCYKLYPDPILFQADAVDFCKTLGGDLLSLETEEEEIFVENLLNQSLNNGTLAGGTDIWLAARRPNIDAAFSWSSGQTITRTDWAPGQPSQTHKGVALCIQYAKYYSGWKWWVANCFGSDGDNAIVCEKSGTKGTFTIAPTKSTTTPTLMTTTAKGLLIETGLKEAGAAIQATFTTLASLKLIVKSAKDSIPSWVLSMCSSCTETISHIEEAISKVEIELGEIQTMLKTMENTHDNIGDHYLTCLNEALVTIHGSREEIKITLEKIKTLETVLDQLPISITSLESAIGLIKSDVNSLISEFNTIYKILEEVDGMIKTMEFSEGIICNAGLGPNTLGTFMISPTKSTATQTLMMTTTKDTSILAALKQATATIEETSDSVITLQIKVVKSKINLGSVNNLVPPQYAEEIGKIENTITRVEVKLGYTREMLTNVRDLVKRMGGNAENMGNYSMTCIKEAETSIGQVVQSITEVKMLATEAETLGGQLPVDASIVEMVLGPIKSEIEIVFKSLETTDEKLGNVEAILIDMGYSTGPACNEGLGPFTLEPPATTLPTGNNEAKILGSYAGPAQNGQVLTFLSETGLSGKYVVVQLGYVGVLNLADVEIRAEALLETGPECSTPPSKQNGNWSCNDDKTSCFLRCNPGFVAHLYSTTTCAEGIWKDINKMECLPSVFLIAGGGDINDVEIYHPNIGQPACSDRLPPLDQIWWGQLSASFYYDDTIYLCGKTVSMAVCFSFNNKVDAWISHTLAIPEGKVNTQSLSIRFDDKIYLFGSVGSDKAFSTTLPLPEEPQWTHENSLSYSKDLPCVVKLNSDTIVFTGGRDGVDSTDVIKRNIVDGTSTTLASMPEARYDHACALVEAEGKQWIVVAGGSKSSNNDEKLNTTQKLDIGENKWTNLGDLNEARTGLDMIVSERGVMVMGGGGINGTIKTMELLNWTSTHWQTVKPSLSSPRVNFGTIEIPASLFNCETQAIEVQGCNGEYEYNMTYGGDVVPVPANQTCHSLCQATEDCKTWTWISQQNECRIQTSNGINEIQTGSVSGMKNTCKPKCYLVIDDDDQGGVNTNTQFCNVTNTNEVTRCWDIIQMEPDYLETSSEILVCYEVVGDSYCEPISYEDVDVICNPEPGIVTLSTYQRINKHRFTTHNRPSFGKWG